MKESGVKPDTFCMNSLMGVVLQAVQPNTALEIFKNMEADGIQRDLVRAPPHHENKQNVLAIRSDPFVYAMCVSCLFRGGVATRVRYMLLEQLW